MLTLQSFFRSGVAILIATGAITAEAFAGSRSIKQGRTRIEGGRMKLDFTGVYRQESSGGPISSVVEWYFAPDRTFRLRGYPELQKDGEYSVLEQGPESVRLKIDWAVGDWSDQTEIILKRRRQKPGPPEMEINGGVFRKTTEPHFAITEAELKLTPELAIEIGRSYISGRVTLSPGAVTEVSETSDGYLVTWKRAPSSVPQPDYDARLEVKRKGPRVTGFLVGG